MVVKNREIRMGIRIQIIGRDAFIAQDIFPVFEMSSQIRITQIDSLYKRKSGEENKQEEEYYLYFLFHKGKAIAATKIEKNQIFPSTIPCLVF
jgi:sulfur relay (sulfurtransferase) DsrC/TusE family protein